MNRETITPLTIKEWLQLRVRDLTSTDISALYGCSPYMTNFELWHRKKKAEVVEIDENERMKWGNRLENAIAKGISEDEGWKIRRMKEYVRLPDTRLGSSFDFAVGKTAILEIKNVDALAYREGWIVDKGNVEAPPHIELQAQHQLLVSGRKTITIGALVGGNKVVLIKREADEKIAQSILRKAAEFWTSIEKNEEPSPQYEIDADYICEMYKYAEPGKVLDATDRKDITDLAAEYSVCGKVQGDARKKQAAIKAMILVAIGDYEKVMGDMFTISAGMVGPVVIEEHERSGFRGFRVSWRKAKENGKA